MGKPVKIVIPFALPGLNELIAAERQHRQKAAKLKREQQRAVEMCIRQQLRRPLREPVTMHYLWVEKDRRRDKDNVSSFGRKIIQDALVSVHALQNDGWTDIDGFTDAFAVDKKRPRVEVVIDEVEP